ncbi:AAA family ATPase [Thauera propionica]|uniref:AAA family ATPase n=1 Tax=Thauera propionica TaxID=2019431 RepID=A0A235EWD0_9RHOO|nr:AAA family ATPase [Thauera propionica]OYD53073.1 AAA family ATPase [Thauera propionica]
MAPRAAAVPHDWPARLSPILAALEEGLVERRLPLRLALLAALSGEHTLLIGPPGTAKSVLARRVHLAFRDARYFERLLTRFTVPEELFGPLSIRALEEDRYERHTAGFLPDATVAFIDEVFKANSAILNALLTLLNEREFDNGAGRQQCPLVSVIGATNAVPEDEVAEAFFDRFLVRLSVGPVSAGGFERLMLEAASVASGEPGAALPAALSAAERAALSQVAQRVALPDDVLRHLGALRVWLAERGNYVSDRRWVKLGQLLRTAAACEGRDRVSAWDLALAPYCVAADAAEQGEVAEWLAARLGVRAAWSPPRLTRIVEAFEAQLTAERAANDLDYDEAGRLRFSAIGQAQEQAEALAGAIGDAKGGAGALRMSYARQRRYGPLHIRARTRQIDELLERIARYQRELAAERAALADWMAGSLWAPSRFAEQAQAALEGVAAALDALHVRAREARAGFESLPRLAEGAGSAPEPVAHEPFAD